MSFGIGIGDVITVIDRGMLIYDKIKNNRDYQPHDKSPALFEAAQRIFRGRKWLGQTVSRRIRLAC